MEVKEIRQYTREEFLTGEAPYRFAYQFEEDKFAQEQVLNVLSEQALTLKVRNFKKMFLNYRRKQADIAREILSDSVTDFEGQELELDAGQWRCTEAGVWRMGRYGAPEFACCHPIMPVRRLVNVDTGQEKLQIAFRKGRQWRKIIVEREILSSANKIVSLSNNGIAVNSENARLMVQYLHDIESQNYDLIPEIRCVGRMGYIQEEGFSPYVDGLTFDGEANYKTLFDAVHPAGNREEWIALARKVRKGGIAGRMALAAAFASPLVSVVNGLPFFLHIWGGESGSGKTVALMLAASVWANPDPAGGYIQTFNSTNVGRERLAAVLNHLPVIVDELQLSNNKNDKSASDIYALAEGIGRTRGNKNGGLDATPTWKNVIVTSGETPITAMGAGAGAMNRVLELEIQPGEKAVGDGPGTAGILKRNYGWAGKEFVASLYCNGNEAAARILQQKYFLQLSAMDTTEKQALSASILLTADAMATAWIFDDGRSLCPEEVAEVLKSKASVSMGVRGYQFLCGWVAQNSNKFRKGTETGDVYGVIESDYISSAEYAYINRAVFNQAAENAGFSVSPLLSYLRSEKLILTRERGFTKCKRVNGVLTECVALKLPCACEEASEEEIL